MDGHAYNVTTDTLDDPCWFNMVHKGEGLAALVCKMAGVLLNGM